MVGSHIYESGCVFCQERHPTGPMALASMGWLDGATAGMYGGLDGSIIAQSPRGPNLDWVPDNSYR